MLFTSKDEMKENIKSFMRNFSELLIDEIDKIKNNYSSLSSSEMENFLIYLQCLTIDVACSTFYTLSFCKDLGVDLDALINDTLKKLEVRFLKIKDDSLPKYFTLEEYKIQ